MTDALIPTELAVAPNPFGLAANLQLMTIPVDAYTAFELWMPKPNALLLPEEARLLVGDRPRLEEICLNLTWLFGATLIEQDQRINQEPQPTGQNLLYDWQAVQQRIGPSGSQFDAIGITYQPQTIYPSLTSSSASRAWTLRPFLWNIWFFDLKPWANGYQAAVRSMSLLITYGHTVTRPMQPIKDTFMLKN